MFGTTQVMSQTYFTLTPMLGMQRCFAKYESGDKPEVFINNTRNDFFHAGLLIDYHRNRFTYSTGYMSNNVGFGFAVEPVTVNPLDSAVSWRTSLASARETYSIPIKVAYTLGEVNLFGRKNPTQYFSKNTKELKTSSHLINFKLNIYGGLIFERLKPSSTTGDTSTIFHVKFENQYTVLNRNGITGMLGISIQFLHKGKEILAMNIYYHQGFTRMMQYDLNYTIVTDNQPYHTTLISKGTLIGVSLSYPIKIWDVDKRKAKRAAGN